jgi:hypothetical protein
MMIRTPLRLGASLVALLVVAAAANAQTRDRIFYISRAKNAVKEDVLRGQITEETPQHIVVTIGTRTEMVPAVDVLDVDHEIPADLNIDIRAKARKEEATADKEPEAAKRLKLYDQAIAGYKELLAKLGKSEKYQLAQRHLEFKIAQLLARQAEDDPSRLDAAVTALAEFKTKHPNGWQIGQAGKLLARAQLSKNDMKGALATYEEFARRDDLGDALRQEYQLLGIKAMLRTGDFADAERKLTALAATLAKDDPQAIRIAIYLAVCKAKTDLAGTEKSLLAVIASDADPAIKGLAHNALGDAYRLNNRLEDAFWQYLWVDQQYNQDREEHAKALYYLSILFDRVKKTPARALACREKLLNDTPFKGMEYQKLAAKENQKPAAEK